MPDRICSVEGCERPHGSRGWCSMHYRRWRKHGTTVRQSPEERFWLCINQNGPVPAERPDLGACWIWSGPLSENGYGRACLRGRHSAEPAHRVTYERARGLVPEGLELDHLCRVRNCVCPWHLEAVTHLENMRRGAIATKTHCKRGHELGADNLIPSAKGRRTCATCAAANLRRYRDRVKVRKGKQVRPREYCACGWEGAQVAAHVGKMRFYGETNHRAAGRPDLPPMDAKGMEEAV